MSSRSQRRSKNTYLFSYGTLIPGYAPPEVAPTVKRLRRVGRGIVRGRLYDLGDYPGAKLGRTNSVIVGQVFELPNDPEVLRRLDEYEGFDPAHPQSSLFVRRRWPVLLHDGSKAMCWIYVYNRSPGAAPSVSSGDFSKFRGQRAR